MPPASNGNPPYKGRSEELTTNIADFCNKICQEPTCGITLSPEDTVVEYILV